MYLRASEAVTKHQRMFIAYEMLNGMLTVVLVMLFIILFTSTDTCSAGKGGSLTTSKHLNKVNNNIMLMCNVLHIIANYRNIGWI